MMIARAPTPTEFVKFRARCSNLLSLRRTNSPRPWSRTIRGAPVKAQNIIVMRPFSRRWAIVSTPLPVWSRYATDISLRTANSLRFPLGEQFTCPLASRGAVVTKNTGCLRSQAVSSSLMPFSRDPMGSIISRLTLFDSSREKTEFCLFSSRFADFPKVSKSRA